VAGGAQGIVTPACDGWSIGRLIREFAPATLRTSRGKALSDLEILSEREKQLLATPMIVPELLQELSF